MHLYYLLLVYFIDTLTVNSLFNSNPEHDQGVFLTLGMIHSSLKVSGKKEMMKPDTHVTEQT